MRTCFAGIWCRTLPSWKASRAWSGGQSPTLRRQRRNDDSERFWGRWWGEENDYFERSFDALDVPESDRTDPDRHLVTEALADLFGRAGREGDYGETLAVLVPAEWCYLDWASTHEGADPEQFYLAEWIDLHAADEFAAFVHWLRGELDRIGPDRSGRRQRRLARHFRRTMTLERSLFDAAYQKPTETDGSN